MESLNRFLSKPKSRKVARATAKQSLPSRSFARVSFCPALARDSD
jgi:hypothetical protein